MRSRMLLSVVGPVGRPEVEEAIRSTLTELPLGSYVWELPPPWSRSEPGLVAEERDIPTKYLAGYFVGPPTGQEDFQASRMAVTVLSGVISSEIGERGLSYSAGVGFLDRAASGGVIYISTASPDASMRITNEVIDMFGGGSIQRYLIKNYADDSVLEYYLSNQTSNQQASFLARSLLLRGSSRTVEDWVQDTRSMTGFDMRRAVEDYVQNIQWAYLGDPSSVPEDRLDEH